MTQLGSEVRMTATATKMTFDVVTRRIDAHGSIASCKAATIQLDTDLAGNPNAFNPAELLLAALSACMIKGIERVTPLMKLQLRGVTVHVSNVAPPTRRESMRYSGMSLGPPPLVRARRSSAASLGVTVANSAPVSIAKRYGPRPFT